MNQLSNYTVGAIKKFRGHDGYGYSCNLLRNGKKVAEIVEDGWGGGLQFHWVDHKTKATVHTLTYDDKPHSFGGTEEEAIFYAEVMKLTKISASGNSPEMSTSPDIVIDDMVNDALTIKKITADLKKNVTIKCKDGKLLTWKISATHTVDILNAHVMKKYPEAKIINSLPIDEVYKIYKEANVIA